MINEDRWINTLTKSNEKYLHASDQVDHSKWVNTISKKNTFSSFKKYSQIGALFVFGLLLVSAVKNETRSLQREVNDLYTSINKIEIDLNQAKLDHEVITSPENITLLAKEYLSINFVSYKPNQIQALTKENKALADEKISIKKNKILSKKIRYQVVKRIKEKKMELKKLQEMYSNPKKLPKEIRMQVAKQIKEKKVELKNITTSPKDVISFEKIRKWGAIQVVKAFLGIPVVPGR